MIVIPGLEIAYQNVPKIATTSLFRWFHGCLSAAGLFVEEDDGRKRFVRDHFKGRTANGYEIKPSADLLQQTLPGYLSFAVTRDPVRRFLSMYSNRVIFHRRLQLADTAKALRRRELPAEPSINDFVTRLEDYRAVSRDIAHHSAPMTHFLGSDMGIYRHLVDISGIDSLIGDILAHWRANGLENVARNVPELGRSQTGGPKLGLELLSEAALESLLEFYDSDYRLVPTVSADEIRSAHRESRRNAVTVPVEEYFPPAPAVAPVQSGAKQRDKASGLAAAPRVQVCPSAVVALARATLAPQPGAKKRFELRGAVVLNPGESRGQYRLVLNDADSEQELQWGRKSPQLAERFPASEAAGQAKFLLRDLAPPAPGQAFTISLKDQAGVLTPVFVIKRRQNPC